MNQLRPLFSVRKFLLLDTETLIHHARIRSLLGQMQADTAQIKEYLKNPYHREIEPINNGPGTPERGASVDKLTVASKAFPA